MERESVTGSEEFPYDVFLSHSSKDKTVVRALAKRLRADGLQVWFDEWELKAGDHIQAKIDQGLEQSRVLVLCMSKNAFGSDWTQLESYTFRFRDPLNKARRFIPLRLDETEVKEGLAQFLYLSWLSDDREESYDKLMEACRPGEKPVGELVAAAEAGDEQLAETAIELEVKDVYLYAFSPDGRRALSGSGDNTLRLWNLDTGDCLRVLEGHTASVYSVAWSPDGQRALSGSVDNTLRLWNLDSGDCLRVLEEHTNTVYSVAWSPDGQRALSGSWDNTLRLWNLDTGDCLRVLEGHTASVWSVALSPDGRRALSGSIDNTLRLWDLDSGDCLRVLEGHTDDVNSVALSPDGRRALSGSDDTTLRLWNLDSGDCLRVLEGHTGIVWSMALSPDGQRALSGSRDNTLRLWNLDSGDCLRVLEGHTASVYSVAWSPDGRRALSGDREGGVRVWDLSEFITEQPPPDTPITTPQSAPDQIQYTNAKVLLVGESGAGKTGLAKRLAQDTWEPSDSTVGAWATHWKLPVESTDGVEREIWLWDFGGQADQRLIHQLYMDETALAVLVFDGQKEDLFDTLGQWDHDLTRAARRDFVKLLAAGRVDASGLRVSRQQVDAFARERGYTGFLETSAKQDIGCRDLKQAVLDGIPWEKIPWRSSPLLFKKLKEEIVRLKDEGRVLLRFNELRAMLQLRLADDLARFTDAELRAVVTLLTGPGVVWELEFGSWVLLQPERINAYAQAVIQTMRADIDERGCLPEEQVLNGDLTYHSSMERLQDPEERFVLLAMHQTLVERGLCLREHTEEGPLLVFPSYYRRERPELVGHPAVLVSYRFNGFLDDIYATLVVKLHHTRAFAGDTLWRYAADFTTTTGQQLQLGVKLNRRAEGAGEIEVYFDPDVANGGENHLQPLHSPTPAAKGPGRAAAAALRLPPLRHACRQPRSGYEQVK